MNRWILGVSAFLCSSSLWGITTFSEPRTQDLNVWLERSSTMVYAVKKAKKWAQEAVDRAQKEKDVSVFMQSHVNMFVRDKKIMNIEEKPL